MSPRRPDRRLAPLATLLAAALSLASGAAARGVPLRSAPDSSPAFRVIVHPDAPLTSIQREELSRLFLKKVTHWPDGTPVLPVDLAEDSEAREAFSRAVHQRRTAAIKSFWQQRVFSGRASPPPEIERQEDVLEYVRAHPGAVAYVSAEADLGAVKVVELLEADSPRALQPADSPAARAGRGSSAARRSR